MTAIEGYVPTADGSRLFFQTLGNGPDALIVPNGPPLLEAFSSLARGRRLIAYDARNRGRSDLIDDEKKIARGIYHDVDDIEAVRSHFDLTTIDLLGHSYMGLTAILYAMRHPTRVRRIIQIGPVGPVPSMQYPPELSYVDDVLTSALSGLRALSLDATTTDPESACRRLWQMLRPIYVVNPADVGKLDCWQRCHLATERAAVKYAAETLIPSYMRLSLGAGDVAMVAMPVLTIHGRLDRSAPYGGGRDWSTLLPDGRLLTIAEGGHMPWIEAPVEVMSAIDGFLDERHV